MESPSNHRPIPLQEATLLKVEGLSKRFGRRWIFRNLSFDLGLGDCLVVTGQNGSGKSTLLKTIASLTSASEGKVILPPGDPRVTIGYSSLESSLYPELSCREHLQLTGDLRGIPSRSNELLEKVGLANAASVHAKELSTGMKARLRLAVAIQSNPLLLLLDEPGASLDSNGRALISDIVAEQQKRGSLLIATNDPSEFFYATHALELN